MWGVGSRASRGGTVRGFGSPCGQGEPQGGGSKNSASHAPRLTVRALCTEVRALCTADRAPRMRIRARRTADRAPRLRVRARQTADRAPRMRIRARRTADRAPRLRIRARQTADRAPRMRIRARRTADRAPRMRIRARRTADRAPRLRIRARRTAVHRRRFCPVGLHGMPPHSGWNSNRLIITSTSRPSVGGVPSSSHRFMRGFSSPGGGTKLPV
jgi:hypothetical protein